MSTEKPSFGHYLRRKRLEAGLSQTKLAELMGVSSTYVSALEGKRIARPRDRTLRTLARALNVPVGEMLSASLGQSPPNGNGHSRAPEIAEQALAMSKRLLRLSGALVREADTYSAELLERAAEVYEGVQDLQRVLREIAREHKGPSD